MITYGLGICRPNTNCWSVWAKKTHTNRWSYESYGSSIRVNHTNHIFNNSSEFFFFTDCQSVWTYGLTIYKKKKLMRNVDLYKLKKNSCEIGDSYESYGCRSVWIIWIVDSWTNEGHLALSLCCWCPKQFPNPNRFGPLKWIGNSNYQGEQRVWFSVQESNPLDRTEFNNTSQDQLLCSPVIRTQVKS